MGRTRWLCVECVLFVLGPISWGQCAAGGTPVTNPAIVPAGAFQQTVAHITTGDVFGNGGGFLTKLSIVNLSAAANTVVVNDISQGGSLIDSCSYSIAGNGTLRITQGKLGGTPETHWAQVGSQAQVGVNLFFELNGSSGVANTVGFNDVAPRTSFSFPVEFQSGSTFHTLGLAVANPNNSTNTVTAALVDSNGNTLGSKQQQLPAFGQLSEDLGSSSTPLGLASFLPAGNFVGSVQITMTSPGSVVGVGDDVGPFFSEAPMFVATAPSGGGSNLSTTVTLSPSDPNTSVGSGSCSVVGVTLTGARATMAVVASPSANPSTAGYNNVLWNAWVDASDHVSLQICKFASGTAFLTAPLTFNIRALTTSSASSIASLTVPAGTIIPNSPHSNNPQCTSAGTAVAAATSSTAVVVTPTTDPASVGWADVQWRGFTTSGGVGVVLCKVGGQVGPSTGPLNFNVALLN